MNHAYFGYVMDMKKLSLASKCPSIHYTPKMYAIMGLNVFGHHPIILEKYESC
jgi:hypothetical protein